MNSETHFGSERVKREIQARFNPIRGLTPEKLSRALDNFDLGYFRDAAVLWFAIEKRDLMIKSVLPKRKKAVARNGWEVLTMDDSLLAVKHQTTLKAFWNSVKVTSVLEQNECGGVSLLLRQMADAIGKRYAVHELVWSPVVVVNDAVPGSSSAKATADKEGTGPTEGSFNSYTAEFRFCPLWFFENRTGRLRYLSQEYGIDGLEMLDGEWLVTVADGIMEAISVAYMFKNLAFKDWVAFNEKYGIPALIGKTDAAPGSEEFENLAQALRDFMNDFAAVMNKSADITVLEVKSGGQLPMQPLIDYCDAMIATVCRGGDLSTISQGNGAVGASLQGDEGTILVEDDTVTLEETLHQVSKLVIQYTHGEEAKAYIKVLLPQKKNVEQDIKVDQFLLGAGAPLGVQNRLEHYGRPVPEEDEELLKATANPVQSSEFRVPNGGPALGNEGDAPLLEVAKEDVAKAVAEDLQPVFMRLAKILEISDPQILRAKAARLLAELPQLLLDINADPRSAHVLYGVLSAALLNGATGVAANVLSKEAA